MNKLASIIALVFICPLFSAQANDHTIIATKDIKWGLLNPLRGDASPRAADLWGDRTKNSATGMLVKFNPGFSSPPHIHNISYRGVVINGLMHNDDPNAEKTWLGTGSYWTQPAGDVHITAANGKTNLIYLEIDSGPYLVKPADQAFDNGESAINVDNRNLVWLSAKDIMWLNRFHVKIAYLWGKTGAPHGSFVKLPAGFTGTIKGLDGLKAVVIKGKGTHSWQQEKQATALSPASFLVQLTMANII